MKYKFNVEIVNIDDIKGIIKGIAAPVGTITKDGRNISFSQEFLKKNLNNIVPLHTEHDDKVNNILGKTVFNALNEKGLHFETQLNLEHPTVKNSLLFSLKEKLIKGVSIQIDPLTVKFNKLKNKINEIIDGVITELSLTNHPAFNGAVISQVFTATSFKDYPMADRDFRWDSSQAEKRIREYTNSIEQPTMEYKNCFMYYEPENEDLFGGYKLPYVDVIDGELKAVPRAIFAIAGVLQGARGGVNIPEDDREPIKNHVAKYYAKMDMKAPWETDYNNYVSQFNDIKFYLKAHFSISNDLYESILFEIKKELKINEGKPQEDNSKYYQDKLVELSNKLNLLNEKIKNL